MPFSFNLFLSLLLKLDNFYWSVFEFIVFFFCNVPSVIESIKYIFLFQLYFSILRFALVSFFTFWFFTGNLYLSIHFKYVWCYYLEHGYNSYFRAFVLLFQHLCHERVGVCCLFPLLDVEIFLIPHILSDSWLHPGHFELVVGFGTYLKLMANYSVCFSVCVCVCVCVCVNKQLTCLGSDYKFLPSPKFPKIFHYCYSSLSCMYAIQ
jgi:hypothetical protein